MNVNLAKQNRTNAQLVDESTTRLLDQIKRRMLKKHGRVDYNKLRKQGYSERILVRLRSV
jgi:hypothetical protein